MTTPTLPELRRHGRDDKGRFTTENLAALKSGRYMQPDHPELTATFSAEHAAIVADMGGTDALSAMELGLARELARVTILVHAAGEELLTHGVVTGKGRARAMLAVYSGLLDRQSKLAGQLGLHRRAKPTGPTHLRDYLDAKS